MFCVELKLHICILQRQSERCVLRDSYIRPKQILCKNKYSSTSPFDLQRWQALQSRCAASEAFQWVQYVNYLANDNLTAQRSNNTGCMRSVVCACERDGQRKMRWNSDWSLPIGAYAGLFITTTSTENGGTVFGTLEFVAGNRKFFSLKILWMSVYVWP